MTTKELGCRGMKNEPAQSNKFWYGFITGLFASWAGILSTLVIIAILTVK